jgi:arabinofuranosyltransferase
MPAKHATTVFVLLLAVTLAVQLVLGVCVQEDAFISFRYARNLVQGHGLVYNVGERVEGYSNFLWTLMVAGGMAAGLDPVPLARFLGIGSSLLLLGLVFFSARRLDQPRGATGGLLAACLVALAPGILIEGVQGLETIFYTLLVTAGMLLGAGARTAEAATGSARPRWILASAGLLALAALTRPDGLGIFGLVTLGALAWRARRSLPILTRWELAAIGLFAVIYVPYWLWRFDYYGYPFPNTFYAKTGGGIWHVIRGFGYLGRFLLYNPVLTLMTAMMIWPNRAIPAAPRRPSGIESSDPVHTLRWIGIAVITGYLAYVICVGGDFKETFRFIVPVLPLWAILLDATVSRRGWWPLAARVAPSGRSRRASMVPAAVLLAVFLNGGLQIPLSSADWVGRRTHDLVRRKACGLYLKSIASPGQALAIHSAGIIPYYSELPTIDMWGVTNLHIAHQRMPDMGRSGNRIGHEKEDYPWVFAQNPTYFVDQYHVITTRPVPELLERLFPTETGRAIARRYEPHSVPLRLDLGEGLREYWFNYIELKRENQH